MASSLNVPESKFLEKSLAVPNSQFEELLSAVLCLEMCLQVDKAPHTILRIKWLARSLHILTLLEYSTPLPLDPEQRPNTKRDSRVSFSRAGQRIGWLKILASTGRAKLFNVSHYCHHQHCNSNAVTCCINLVLISNWISNWLEVSRLICYASKLIPSFPACHS